MQDPSFDAPASSRGGESSGGPARAAKSRARVRAVLAILGAVLPIAALALLAPAGALVRGVPFWPANIVMGTVVLHLGRIFVAGAYERPRAAHWPS